MAKKKKIPDKYQVWIDARKRFRLSHIHIQMARELGMNPKKFGKIANHKQQPWKAPLPVFIEGLYFKRFGKTRPEQVKTIEQLFKDQERKKANRFLDFVVRKISSSMVSFSIIFQCMALAGRKSFFSMGVSQGF